MRLDRDGEGVEAVLADRRPWRDCYEVVSTTTKRNRRPGSPVFGSPPGGFSLPPVHPGKTLAAEIAARDLSAHALALKLRVPANRITEIVAGKRSISAETALRLGRYFGNGGGFWMALQSQ
jgi:addiction module HigA family antidote